MKLTFEVQGEELLVRHFDRAIAGVKDFKLFMPKMADLFDEIQQNWFNSQGNGTWVALSPAYAAWKAINYPSQPLLVLTGALAEAPFTAKVVGDKLTVQSDAPDYWKFHYHGTSRMPARPPYIVDQTVRRALGREMRKLIIAYLRGIK